MLTSSDISIGTDSVSFSGPSHDISKSLLDGEGVASKLLDPLDIISDFAVLKSKGVQVDCMKFSVIMIISFLKFPLQFLSVNQTIFRRFSEEHLALMFTASFIVIKNRSSRLLILMQLEFSDPFS